MVKKIVKQLYLRFLKRNELEGIELRQYFKGQYCIDVGLYSYGCFDVSRIPRGISIGRYCSFAPTVYVLNRNHGLDFLSLHPYLYNKNLGMVYEDNVVKSTNCTIEDDVWLGHNAVVTPGVAFIGRGSVIGAGAVVTKDVPAYAIVVGNPAKVIRYRFSPAVIEKIEASKWWELSKKQLHDLICDDKDFVYRPATFTEK